MKKSVKILIVILCLVIVGLLAFIVVDKCILEKNNDSSNTIATEKTLTNATNNNNSTSNEISNEVSEQNKITNNNSAEKSEIEVANEAIRNALKNEEWIKENVYCDHSGTFEGIYGDNWYDEAKKNLVLGKVIDKEFTNPAYIVGSNYDPAGSDFFVLIQYKDGKVTSEWVPEPDYAFATFDLNKGVVCSTGDFHTTYQKIKNGKFVEFARKEVEEDVDGEGVYYYNDIECTKMELEEHIKEYNFQRIQTKLTDENIDKYVK